MDESTYLKSSDARNFDFSLNSCIRRLKAGHTIIGFNYNTAQVQEVEILLTDTHLVMIFESKETIRISYKDISGVFFSKVSSTFKMYSRTRGNLSTLGLENNDAFSILTKNRCFDFACTSELVKYDICLVASWIASDNSRYIPFNKSTFTRFKVTRKIHEMAHEKGLFFKELILVRFI